ncbi:MAG: heavy metal-responsive transcriptional regulator [Candidatus Thiodiazotropha taylori]|jgi:DNA-binding transcriptional MerR regulator|uniref:Heavy metal-responsive transcriptional regulator n=1 Tax=Candidatus Thiodiazotropha taylori TaxID=2792791 RepID=A0A9E4KEE3_9GAMM|nr:heavy metal-responsive transcriptional regulator [Aestuariicella albida]MBU3069210.1 heavy metal-responsive transcriptional regulator [Aestuariicella albida]MCG7947336.1 heavy metal-responsive transcriptional regulator [Candidatus Thiodiazotropha taylori]MCW4257457.1 heavy metal-responsive transcriptional regulator [Candidatus Thiodiazotropha taylori]
MKIGDLAKKADVTVDTLRYYEKIGLLNGVKRSSSGYRSYDQNNVEQVRFIRNAQHSGFSLDEIAQLLKFRAAPIDAKPKVRSLAEVKVSELSERIEGLIALRDEMKELIEQCVRSGESECPIIDSFNAQEKSKKH